MLRVIALLALFGCAISITLKNDHFLSELSADSEALVNAAFEINTKIKYGHKAIYVQPEDPKVEAEFTAFTDKILEIKNKFDVPSDNDAVNRSTALAVGVLYVKAYNDLSPATKAYVNENYPDLVKTIKKMESDLADIDRMLN